MASNLLDIPLHTIDGHTTSLREYDGKVVLIVNVASKCGFTPQYEALEALYTKYGPDHFVILGFPCNQFLGQEPGTAEQIQQFCSVNYGVTFPLFDKINVNGFRAHPLYAALKRTKDDRGKSGRVAWNFEKFLLSPDGSIRRFRSKTRPDDPIIVSAIEGALTYAE